MVLCAVVTYSVSLPCVNITCVVAPTMSSGMMVFVIPVSKILISQMMKHFECPLIAKTTMC